MYIITDMDYVYYYGYGLCMLLRYYVVTGSEL